MTPVEIAAYDSGVRAVLDLALRSAEALRAKVVDKPTRYNFAIGALEGIAEDGAALLLPSPDRGAMTVPIVPLPTGPKPASSAAALT